MKLFGENSTFYKGVTIPGLIIIIGVTAFCGLFPDTSTALLANIQTYVVTHFGWAYVILFSIYIFFLVFLAASNLGNIRLGSDYTKPKYSFATWIAMLFAAGMGIGLMFFGVAETISHYSNPPIAGMTMMERAKNAQLNCFFHWGIHGWAVYGLVALALAYFRYRYKLPLAIRSAFYPILKDKIYGRIGDCIDVFALCSTVFGLTTTLGYGVLQLNGGLKSAGVINDVNFGYQAILIVIAMGLAVASTISGLDKGVKRLSQLNMILGFILMMFVLLAGPTQYIMAAFSEGLGAYLSNFLELTFNTYAYEPEAQQWFSDWTVIYWAWWISWSPFVGLFIAGISKGRTIREFIVGVTCIPTIFIFLWMSTFGNSAVWFDQQQAAGALSGLSNQVELLLFSFFEYLPFSGILKGLAMVMIIVFFITSADSGILVINSIASGGNSKGKRWQNAFWGVLLILLAMSLLRSGGLKALQTLTLISALPFGIILVMVCFCLWKALTTDMLYRDSDIVHGSAAWQGERWREKLRKMLSFSKLKEIDTFLENDVAWAFDEFKNELHKSDIVATINQGKTPKKSFIELVIPYDKLQSFTYGVFSERKRLPDYFVEEENAPDVSKDRIYIPLTYFNDGRTGYDIQYLTKEEILADILREYGRFLEVTSNESAELLAIDRQTLNNDPTMPTV